MTTIGTWTGNQLNFASPTPDQIDIRDIARGLAHTCRFSGQLDYFYSVAEHSIRCSMLAYEKTRCPVIAMQALLHDASEAYMGDCPSPLKGLLGASWAYIEEEIQRAVYTKFDLPHEMHAEVKTVDRIALVTEQRGLQSRSPKWTNTKYTNIPSAQYELFGDPPADIERWFLKCFHSNLKARQIIKEAAA